MLSDILGAYEPQWQAPLRGLPEAGSLAQMVLTAWTVMRLVAVRLLEEALTLRAPPPPPWPHCGQWGRRLQSKGFRPRMVRTLLGELHWRRREGRCPQGCAGVQVAP